MQRIEIVDLPPSDEIGDDDLSLIFGGMPSGGGKTGCIKPDAILC